MRRYEVVENSSNQLANALVKLRFMQSIRQNDTEKLGNGSNVGIRFDRNRTERIASVQNKGIFEKIDGSFNGHSVTVEIIPMLRTAGNTGIKTKVFVGISVDALPIR